MRHYLAPLGEPATESIRNARILAREHYHVLFTADGTSLDVFEWQDEATIAYLWQHKRAVERMVEGKTR